MLLAMYFITRERIPNAGFTNTDPGRTIQNIQYLYKGVINVMMRNILEWRPLRVRKKASIRVWELGKKIWDKERL